MYQYWQFWAFVMVLVAIGFGMWKGFIPNPFKKDDDDDEPNSLEPNSLEPNSGEPDDSGDVVTR